MSSESEDKSPEQPSPEKARDIAGAQLSWLKMLVDAVIDARQSSPAGNKAKMAMVSIDQLKEYVCNMLMCNMNEQEILVYKYGGGRIKGSTYQDLREGVEEYVSKCIDRYIVPIKEEPDAETQKVPDSLV